MRQEEFDSFFSSYSKNVDKAERQGFWRLSDVIVESLIRTYMSAVDKDGTILDAGGGTARWACRLAPRTEANFIVYDKSRDMLEQAARNISASGLSQRIKLVRGEAEDMAEIPSGSVDFIYSTYGVISFIGDIDKAFSEFYRILKPGGVVLVMGHGFGNSLSSKINNYVAPADEIGWMTASANVKWADYVPVLKTFSRESLRDALSTAGFKPEKEFGVPVFVQPGAEDFDPNNERISKISAALADESLFKQVYDTEMAFNSHPNMVDRGVNVIAVGRKS